jgi:hypothetical protein
MGSKRLSPAEIADRWTKGLCFKCDEKFILGHKEECKQLFTIELLDEDDDKSTPMISLHACAHGHSALLRVSYVGCRDHQRHPTLCFTGLWVHPQFCGHGGRDMCRTSALDANSPRGNG